jgi:tetratricopeptide (TPR) repeat protein
MIGVLPILTLPSAMAQKSAYGVDWACGYEEGSSFVDRLKRGSEEDLSCLVGAGFLEEALPRIGPRMDLERQRLKRFLELMVKKDETAFQFFEVEAQEGTDEAVLWLLIASGENGLQSSDVRTRNIAVNLFASLPPWVRSRYASDLAGALLAEGDSRAALALATMLQAIADGPDERAKAALVRGRVIERFGTVDEAVALYEEAISLGNDRLQAEAELRKIALMWRTGHLKTEEAVVVLRELVTIWRGENLGAGITLALARAYYFDGQLAQSLRLLAGLAGSNGPEEIVAEAEERMRSTAEDLFVRRTQASTIGDLMDVYGFVRPLIGPKTKFWMGDLSLSEILAEAGLLAGAEELISGVEAQEIKAAGGDDALLRAADLSVGFGDRTAARIYLGAIEERELTDRDARTFHKLAAHAAEIEDLKAVLLAYPEPDVIAIVEERAWREGAYGLYKQARLLTGETPSGWKEPTAAYLATGSRLAESETQPEDPRLKALSSAPQPSVYHASDLRPLLETSAKVADLAVTLTPMGHGDGKSSSGPASAGEGVQSENEQAL